MYYFCCTGQEVSSSTTLSGRGGSGMFSPKASPQSTPVAGHHAYKFKHPSHNQHSNPSNYTHIIKSKVNVILASTTQATVMLFLYRYWSRLAFWYGILRVQKNAKNCHQ